ncbi:MAG TPA: hypothetical protein VGA73_04130 [Candidatus Binatia bacterium]
MIPVVGIFDSVGAARAAVVDLLRSGFASHQITFLAPGASEDELRESVPTTEGEQPGMGKAVGAVVGTGLGASLGMAAATALVPGVGPVVALGVAGAALLGLVGATAGGALERAFSEGLPKDEWFVYEDALRRGRSIVAVFPARDEQAEFARALLARRGAESVDAARERWWIGLRSAEAERYAANETDFDSIEPDFRRGFEAALRPDIRGRSYDLVVVVLSRHYPTEYDRPHFRAGYDRGSEYCRARLSSAGPSDIGKSPD